MKILGIDRIPGLYLHENNVLYLALMLNCKKVVGYKKIDVLNNQIDTTEPFDDCWGIAQVPPSLVNRDESAIVVDDFKSFLVLAAHKLPHHIVCLPHGMII